MKHTVIFLAALAITAIPALAQKHIGNYSANPYNADSTSNPYGAGSPYNSDSINNSYGEYGSSYSSKSANNPYATDAPKFIRQQR